MSNNTSEDDCSGCDALGVFKQMTAGLPNKGSKTTNNSKPGSDAPKKPNNIENTKNNTPNNSGNYFWLIIFILNLLLIFVNSRRSSYPNTPNIKYSITDEFWEKENPPDITELGRSGWTVLHSVAAYFPEKPTEDNKTDATNFLNGFARLFPCKVCATDFQEVLTRHPPRLDNRKEFNMWMCEAHNEVNKKLGKPLFDCSTIEDRWKAIVKKQK